MRRTISRLLGIVALASSLVAATIATSSSSGAGAVPSAIATRFTTIPGDPTPTMTCQVVTVDLGAGTITPLGPLLQSELCPVDYAVRADGGLYGVTLTGLTTQDPSPLVLVDPVTGEQSVVGSTEIHVTDIGGLELDATGTLWFAGKTTEHGCDGGLPCLYRIDPDTATATFVGQLNSTLRGFIGGLTRGCADVLYTNLIETAAPTALRADDTDAVLGGDVGVAQPGTGVLSRLDTTTAQLATIGELGGTTSAGGLAFATDGTLWGIVASALAPPRTYSSATIDPTTGVATLVAALPVSDDPSAFETMTGLTFGPLDCAAPPIVLEPTFTG